MGARRQQVWTAIYGCATIYEKNPYFNMIITVSFISLRLVIFFDNPMHLLVM
jgi:hypothetical protein